MNLTVIPLHVYLCFSLKDSTLLYVRTYGNASDIFYGIMWVVQDIGNFKKKKSPTFFKNKCRGKEFKTAKLNA